jgi:hypothetical protein
MWWTAQWAVWEYWSQRYIKIISITLKKIIATNEIDSGRIPIYNETRMALFQCFDPDSISFVKSKMIRGINASIPYAGAGRPIGVVMEITPASAEDVTVVVVAVIVVDIILMSIVITSNNRLLLLY